MKKQEWLNLKIDIPFHLKELLIVLPKKVDPRDISLKSKVPYKMLDSKASLLWRTNELSNTAFECLNKNSIASGILLVRALVETSAVLWHIYEMVKEVSNKRNIQEFDKKIMQILLGSKNSSSEFDSINVLTLIDKMDRVMKGVRENYDFLSEYAHPNYSGTHGLYAKIHKKDMLTTYGDSLADETIKTIGYSVINISIQLAIFINNNITELEDDFINVCELDKK